MAVSVNAVPSPIGERLIPVPGPEQSSEAPRRRWPESFRQEWEALLAKSDNLYVQYQSPAWFDHLRCTEADRVCAPVTKRDEMGRLLGVVPLRLGRYHLTFEIKGHIIWALRLRTAFVLGSQPLLAPDPRLYDELFASVCAVAPQCDCLYLHSVPTDSFCWSHLQNSGWIAQQFHMYLPDGVRPFHSLRLPATPEDYLSKFKAKKRYNLERQVRLLRERGRGRLRCVRIDRPDQIQGFVNTVSAVTQRSWQDPLMWRDLNRQRSQAGSLKDLAHRGLLRSYTLICGDTPCALVLGYQFRDVYHYAEIGYDQSLRRFSPGTVLLYLLIQDLMRHNPPRRVNFGIGDAQYKREFGNEHSQDASVLLLRKTAANALRVGCHSSFRSAVRIAKARLQGWLQPRGSQVD